MAQSTTITSPLIAVAGWLVVPRESNWSFNIEMGGYLRWRCGSIVVVVVVVGHFIMATGIHPPLATRCNLGEMPVTVCVGGIDFSLIPSTTNAMTVHCGGLVDRTIQDTLLANRHKHTQRYCFTHTLAIHPLKSRIYELPHHGRGNYSAAVLRRRPMVGAAANRSLLRSSTVPLPQWLPPIELQVNATAAQQ